MVLLILYSSKCTFSYQYYYMVVTICQYDSRSYLLLIEYVLFLFESRKYTEIICHFRYSLSFSIKKQLAFFGGGNGIDYYTNIKVKPI